MIKNFKPTTDERPVLIIIGILTLYLLIAFFISYFYFLGKISLTTTILSIIILTIIYLPRLLIIKKLINKDNIKILDDGIKINNQVICFSQINDFRVEEKKPSVVFCFNNSLIIFQEAKFHLK